MKKLMPVAQRLRSFADVQKVFKNQTCHSQTFLIRYRRTDFICVKLHRTRDICLTRTQNSNASVAFSNVQTSCPKQSKQRNASAEFHSQLFYGATKAITAFRAL